MKEEEEGDAPVEKDGVGVLFPRCDATGVLDAKQERGRTCHRGTRVDDRVLPVRAWNSLACICGVNDNDPLHADKRTVPRNMESALPNLA